MNNIHSLGTYTEGQLRERLEKLSQGPESLHAALYQGYLCSEEDCPWNDPNAVEGEVILREQERAR